MQDIFNVYIIPASPDLCSAVGLKEESDAKRPPGDIGMKEKAEATKTEFILR